MQYAFISGIPAAGKSYLARKVAAETGAQHIEIDTWREEFALRDPELKKWVNFFLDKNETEYWQITPCDEQWQNLKNQSEAMWPEILKKIREIQATGVPAIFEGVNILPHLARKDLGFEGIFLLGESVELIFERNKKEPRWGQTEELQRKEAEAFFNCEGLMYKKEAEKYDFKTFRNIGEAEAALVKLIS